MGKDYECSICGAQEVKLWRPRFDSAPLLCAKCLQKYLANTSSSSKIPRLRENLITVNDEFSIDLSEYDGRKGSITIVAAIRDHTGYFIEPSLALFFDRNRWHSLPIE